MIKYPTGSKNDTSKIPTENKIKLHNLNKAHLGMTFEDMINSSNDFYLKSDYAVIHKKPIPIQITKVDYPSRHQAKITEAFYKVPSTTDYNGIYKGYHIDFEAKSCNGKSFPLQNIYPHQINHLSLIARHGGIAFLLIMFNDTKDVFILDASLLANYYELSLNGGRKSITLDYFKTNGIQIEKKYPPIIDYLTGVDILIKKKESEK